MILLLTETLTAGGAEIFVLRLARQLRLKGFECIVFNYHKSLVNARLMDEFKDLKIIHFDSVFDGVILKLDRLFQKLKLDISLRQILLSRQLKAIIAQYNVQVIHSHLFKVDYSVALINADLKIRHIITNHGDYHLYHTSLEKGDSKDIIQFHKKAGYVFRNVSSIICISCRQITEITNAYGEDLKHKARIIYNGLTIKKTESRSRQELNIPDNAFVFGMVARGIREKGWEFVISAFNELNNPDAHLILVGDGDYLRTQNDEIEKNKNIHWVGFSQNPLEWIALFDVGLLPSFYKAESQPNVILEYLAMGKPVISSDVGDVSLILNIENPHQCGFVVEVKDAAPQVDVLKLLSIMDAYVSNRQMLIQHSQNAGETFKNFDMNTCVKKYIAEYFIQE